MAADFLNASDYLAAAQRAGQECLDAALLYLHLGWPALALCPPDHMGVGRNHGRTCESPGKRPWHYWTDFYDRLPTAEEVRGWWKDNRLSNVGVAMGPVAGLVGLDPDGPAGEAKLLEMSGGDLPPTLEFATPGGGRRLLYGIPAGATFRPTYLALGRKEELRFLGYGAQTVMPPSRHMSGGRYAWRAGRGPGEIAAAPSPAWLVEFLTAPAVAERQRTTTPLADGELIFEGRRNGFLTSLAGTMRSRGFGGEAILAALTVENGERCDPPLAQHEVETIARSVSRYEAGTPDVLFGRKTPDVGHSLGLTVMADLKPQPLRWLVPGYFPLGKLILLAGDGGHGKSMVTLHIAAALSVGRRPFGVALDRTERYASLLVSCEDDYEDTILPRLMAAGADLSRIFRVDGIKGKDGKMEPFSLAHYQAIEEELNRRPDVKLIVIDPAGAYVGRTGIDDYKDSELRALLGPLTELAGRRAVTILLVKHLSKNATPKAVHKVGGSMGYVNAVRAAYLIAPDPDEDGKKFFMPLKFNLGPKPQAMAYRLASLQPAEQAPILARCSHLVEEDQSRLAAQLFRVHWLGVVEADADAVMATRSRAEANGVRFEQAADWLLKALKDGPLPSEDVISAGKKVGISRNQLFTARKEMKDLIRARKTGMGGNWVWELIEASPVNGVHAQRDSSDSLDAWDSSKSTKAPEESEEFNEQQDDFPRPFDDIP